MLRLCAPDEVAEGQSRGFEIASEKLFAVRKNGQLYAYRNRCPHAGFPIAMEIDRYLTPDGALILCGWHGAVFEPLTGECKGGPCAGGRLTPWPVTASGGIVRTA